MRILFLIILSVVIGSNAWAQMDSSFQTTWTFGAEKAYVQSLGNVKPGAGIGLGLHAEKRIFPYLGLRVQLGMGQLQGINTTSSQNWSQHPVWSGAIDTNINYNNATANYVYNNFKTQYLELNLQALFRFTQLPFVNNKSPFDAYLMLGIGAMRYQTFIDAADAYGNIYDFGQMQNLRGENRVELKADLMSFMDGKYETAVQANPMMSLQYQLGLGFEYRISPQVSFTLSHRVSMLQAKDIDSYRWDANSNPKNSYDWLQYSAFSINYSIGKKQKAEPAPIVIDTVEVVKEDTIVQIDVPDPIVEPLDTAINLSNEEEEILKQAFDNLEFETSKAVIKKASFEPLNKLANVLLKHPDWKLDIAGHTDNVGNAAENMELSKKRAEAVRDYIIAKGVNKDSFIVSWFGETKPIADNNTSAGRQKNRRVELKIVR
jgi:outer membrane protein OmpA-like peptidoglycan-associated protein